MAAWGAPASLRAPGRQRLAWHSRCPTPCLTRRASSLPQELAAGDSPGEAALALKARLVVAHLPPGVKLTIAKPANGAAPCLRAGGADIPAGSAAALRWGSAVHVQKGATGQPSSPPVCCDEFQSSAKQCKHVPRTAS